MAVVDFLSGKELKQLFLTCSALCTVAERVAKEKAERVSHAFPTGPIVETKKMKGLGKWVLAEGDNDFGLRAPEDCKSWVGIFNYMERMTRDAFYFGFQMERDSGVASRFLQSRNKFTFGPTYRNMSAGIQPGETCLSIRGGQLHVSGQFPGIVGSSHIASSERTLQTGIYRIICRIFCPFSSDSSRPTIDILGSIGILRKTHGDEPLINWAHKETVLEGWQREEGIVGLEYNANTRVLKAHQIAFRPAGRIITSEVTIDDLEGDLYFAAELTSKAVEVKNTLLSVRKCDEQEYSEFVSHISEDLSYIIDRRGRDRMGFFGNMEDIRIDNDDDGDNRRIRHLRMLRRQNGDMQERADPGNARRDRQFDEAVVAEPVVRYFFNADAPREPNDLQPQEHNEEPQNAASRVLARLRGAIDGRREQRQMEMRRESRSNALEPRRREEEIMHDALDVDANVDILFENPPPDDIPRMADRGMFRQIVRPTNARQGAAIRDVQPARQEAVALQEVEEIELDNAVRQEFHRRHYHPPDDMVPRWPRRGSTFRQNIPIGQPTNVRQGAAIRDVQPARQEAVALQEVEVDVAFAMQPENEGPDMADVLETSGVRQAFRQEAVAMQPEIHWADFDVLEEFVDDE